MNNPFTSDRNIFNNIPKIKKPVQSQKAQNTSSQNIALPQSVNQPSNRTNINNLNNLNSATVPNITSYSKLNPNQMASQNSNIVKNDYQASIPSSNVIGSANINNNKMDLNFRSQFRNPSPYQAASQNNYQTKDPKLQSQYQASSVSDNQFSSYHQGNSSTSSAVPSMTIPTSNLNYTSSYTNSKAQGFQSQGIGNNNKLYQDGYVSGVERQKITFGISSNQDNDKKLQYDNSNSVNRQQFLNGTSSNSNNAFTNSYNSAQRNSNYKNISNTNFHAPNSAQNPQFASQSSPTSKNIPQLSMSPIQQHSKHQFDQIGQQGLLDLDAMGDDIQKILASSKNQQQLCRLLGIDGQTIPNKNNVNYNNMPINHDYHRSNSQNPHMSTKIGQPKQQNIYHNPGFPKKTSLPQNISDFAKSVNSMGFTGSNARNNHNYYERQDQIQIQQYGQQRQSEKVFNYESENIYNLDSKASNNIAFGGAPMKKQSNLYKSSNQNAASTVNKYVNSASPTQFASQLQSAIDNQMKKMYLNGKMRIFLSASDRIQTVKYNMEYL